MNDWLNLDGRTALVTGGSKGMGRAMAEALAAAGARVAVCSRNGAESEVAAAEIRAATNVECFGFEADVTERASVERLAEACRSRFGGIDILINNAGINIRKPTVEFSDEEWDAVIDISLKGSLHCSQAFLPGMIERRWGRIVMLGSTMSFVSLPMRAAYSSAKAGLLGLTRALALEAAPHGVTVNCLCPGPFETPMNRVLIDDPVANEAFLAKVPVGRWGQPSELGAAIVWMCCEASGFMTGTSIVIDGGWTAM